MPKMQCKSFDRPDEVRSIPKGKLELVQLGDVTTMRAQFEPGWRWSECVKPMAGTDSCQVAHLMHVVSGRMVVRMDDGAETEFGPGDVGSIPPGHDAWIVGSEPFVGIDFQGGATYAKAGSQRRGTRREGDERTAEMSLNTTQPIQSFLEGRPRTALAVAIALLACFTSGAAVHLYDAGRRDARPSVAAVPIASPVVLPRPIAVTPPAKAEAAPPRPARAKPHGRQAVKPSPLVDEPVAQPPHALEEATLAPWPIYFLQPKPPVNPMPPVPRALLEARARGVVRWPGDWPSVGSP